MADSLIKTCANCEQTSVYEISDPGSSTIYLCVEHLPSHLAVRAALNQFKTVGVFTPTDNVTP